MDLMITSAKPSSESSSASSSYNETPLLARPNPTFFLQQHNDAGLIDLEEFEAPIDIYHEHKGRLEEDKRARTELDMEILNEDLYCPVQHDVNKNASSRGSDLKHFSSFFPSFLQTTPSAKDDYAGIMESAGTDSWSCHHNDMFSVTNNMFGIFGIDGSAQ